MANRKGTHRQWGSQAIFWSTLLPGGFTCFRDARGGEGTSCPEVSGWKLSKRFTVIAPVGLANLPMAIPIWSRAGAVG